jgi:hypothetical protein
MNYDTVQECYGTRLPEGLAERLDEAQELAKQRHDGQGTSFNFGGELFQVWSGGSSGGNKWVVADDDLQFHIKEQAGWNVIVRYTSAGLWEYGIEGLKHRVIDLLTSEGFEKYNATSGNHDDWVRLSRIDYALDVYSPEFSKEQIPGLIAKNMLLPANVSAGIIFNGRRNETLQIGMNKQGVIIQVYDKGKELTDKPGKEWMYDIWEMSGYETPINDDGKKRAKDVWRFEIRFGSDFLKDKRAFTFERFQKKKRALIEEVIDKRCMIAPTIKGKYVGLDCSHRERLDFHPLWAFVDSYFTTEKGHFVPRGRIITMARERYIEMLEKQQSGLGRSLATAQYGGYDEDLAREDALRSVELAISDPKHEDKMHKCMEKQLFIDEAG